MLEHEKNDLSELKDIDDASVEELSHVCPMLGRSAKKRILEKCLEKTEEAGFAPDGITVSGTEIYSRPIWRRIAGTAAAAAAAIAVISCALYLRKTIDPPVKDPLAGAVSSRVEENTEENTDDLNEEEYTEAVTTEAVTQVFEAVTTDMSLYAPVTSSYLTTSAMVSTETTAETTTAEETTTDEEGAAEATTETQAQFTADMFSGKWEASGIGDGRTFEFDDDTLGGRISDDSSAAAFTYEINGNTLSFRFGFDDGDPTDAVAERTDSEHMLFHWEDGNVETLTKTE